MSNFELQIDTPFINVTFQEQIKAFLKIGQQMETLKPSPNQALETFERLSFPSDWVSKKYTFLRWANPGLFFIDFCLFVHKI